MIGADKLMRAPSGAGPLNLPCPLNIDLLGRLTGATETIVLDNIDPSSLVRHAKILENIDRFHKRSPPMASCAPLLTTLVIEAASSRYPIPFRYTALAAPH